MNKPVVLFDADGFLLDFMTPALEVASNITGVKWAPDSFQTWDIFDTIGKEHQKLCYLEYEKPGFCAAFEPYPDAVEGVREAKKMADVVVVTSPLHSPTWCHERRQSLFQHFDIPAQDVIFASRKTLIMGCMLVDDRPSHAEDWAREHYGRGFGVIWNQPYNSRHCVEGRVGNITRCSSWFGSDGLLEYIKRVAT